MSLHLSVMVRTRLWSDLLSQAVDRLLDDPAFWEFPYLNEATVTGQAGQFAAQADRLASRLEAMDVTAEVRRLIGEGQRSGGSSRGNMFAQLAAVDGIEPGTRLRRTGVEVSFGEADNGKTKARVNGHMIALPTPVAATLRDMTIDGEIAAADLFPAAGPVRSASPSAGPITAKRHACSPSRALTSG